MACVPEIEIVTLYLYWLLFPLLGANTCANQFKGGGAYSGWQLKKGYSVISVKAWCQEPEAADTWREEAERGRLLVHFVYLVWNPSPLTSANSI